MNSNLYQHYVYANITNWQFPSTPKTGLILTIKIRPKNRQKQLKPRLQLNPSTPLGFNTIGGWRNKYSKDFRGCKEKKGEGWITSDNGDYRTLSTELASSDHNLLYRHGQIPSQNPQNKRPITSGRLASRQKLSGIKA